MFRLDDVKEYIKEKKFGFIVDVRFRPSDASILFYIQQDKILDKATKGYTSARQIEYLKKNISSRYNKSVEVIVVQSDDHHELETGIYQILNRKFDEKIISLYISFSGKKSVNAWIEVENLNEKLKGDIEERLRSVLAEANIFVNMISWVNVDSELPTLASLLRQIKIHQPLEIHELLQLLNKDYPSIPDKWLNRKMDQLRKKGFVRREGNGCYVLSAIALAAVPAGTRYTSSDIERALALGKKKW